MCGYAGGMDGIQGGGGLVCFGTGGRRLGWVVGLLGGWLWVVWGFGIGGIGVVMMVLRGLGVEVDMGVFGGVRCVECLGYGELWGRMDGEERSWGNINWLYGGMEVATLDAEEKR